MQTKVFIPIRKEDCKGKTVARVEFSAWQNMLAVVFDDGTFFVAHAEAGYEAGTAEMVFPCGLDIEVANNLRLVNEVEYQAYEAARSAEVEAVRKEARRRNYEILKAEFEGGDNG